MEARGRVERRGRRARVAPGALHVPYAVFLVVCHGRVELVHGVCACAVPRVLLLLVELERAGAVGRYPHQRLSGPRVDASRCRRGRAGVMVREGGTAGEYRAPCPDGDVCVQVREKLRAVGSRRANSATLLRAGGEDPPVAGVALGRAHLGWRRAAADPAEDVHRRWRRAAWRRKRHRV